MRFPFIKKAYRAVKKVFKGRRRVNKRKASGGNVMRLKKVVLKDRINVLSNTTTYAIDTFELADVPQYATYSSLYEEFRIDKITVKFMSLNNIASGTTAPSGIVPFMSLGMIHSVVDTNDDSVPTTIQGLMNDPAYRGTRSNLNHTRSFVPKFLNVVGGGSPAQSKSGWLKTEFNNITHYGIKVAFEGGVNSSLNAISYTVEPIITYYLSFKNPK